MGMTLSESLTKSMVDGFNLIDSINSEAFFSDFAGDGARDTMSLGLKKIARVRDTLAEYVSYGGALTRYGTVIKSSDVRIVTHYDKSQKKEFERILSMTLGTISAMIHIHSADPGESETARRFVELTIKQLDFMIDRIQGTD